MKLFKEVLNWLMWSSVNSDKISLTLKSGVTLLAVFGVEQATGDALADGLLGFLLAVAQAVSFAGLVWGSARKVAVTLMTWWENR